MIKQPFRKLAERLICMMGTRRKLHLLGAEPRWTNIWGNMFPVPRYIP